jgi:hypothetical protein
MPVKKNEMRIADSVFDRVQARNGLRAKNQSQMSKLIPMLQIGTKKGPDDAQVLTKLEQRETDLKALAAEFDNLTQRLPTMGTVSKERQLKRLTDALKGLTEIRDRKVPQGTSKALRSVLNELTSLREAAYLDELDEHNLDLTTTEEFKIKIRTLIATTARKIEEHKYSDGTESRDPVFGSEIAAVIESTRQSAHTLPTLGSEPYAVARTSILPTAKTAISIDALTALGFQVTNLAGYPVLHSQLVLSVNPKHGTVDEVLTALRKSSKQKLVLVYPRPIGGNGSLWYWLMRETELDAFATAFVGRSLQLRGFGFGN